MGTTVKQAQERFRTGHSVNNNAGYIEYIFLWLEEVTFGDAC